MGSGSGEDSKRFCASPTPFSCLFEMLQIPGTGSSGLTLGLVKQILGYFTISI